MESYASHPHWPLVRAVCNRLADAGHVVYLAGGCVRDALMGRVPHDFDVATSAAPDQVAELFPESLTVGRAFGVVILPRDGFQIEVATFRKDGEYRDGRRPESVTFCGPEDDARRRDFTVNALFYDPQTGRTLDFVGGESDIRARIIRAVGDPNARFDEDKLRLLRAVRFACQLDFEMEPATWAAVCARATRLVDVSRERIREELTKLLKAPSRAKGLRLLREAGLLALALPDVERAFLAAPEAPQRALKALQAFGPDEAPEVLWAALIFPAVGGAGEASMKAAQKIMLDLKCSREFAASVGWILSVQSQVWLSGDLRVADIVMTLADPRSALAERLQLALAGAAGQKAQAEEAARKRAALRLRFLPNGVLPEPFLDGADLQNLGVKPSPDFGRLLKEAFRLQIERRLSSREEALAWLELEAKT